MSEHTKGRLSVEYQGFGYGYDLDTEDRATLAEGLSEANARRLAACWNACEGISTENLEENLPLVDGLRSLNGELREANERLSTAEALTQQQDALLAKKACATKECRELLAARADIEKARKRDEEWHEHTTRKAFELTEALVDRDIAHALLREVLSEVDNMNTFYVISVDLFNRSKSYLNECDTLEGKPCES